MEQDMSKSGNDHSPHASTTSNAFSDTSLGNMRTLTGQGQTYLRSVARWHEEMSRFLSHRFGKDARALHAAAGCKDVPTLLSVQQKWANEMVSDYLEQSSRMVTVATELGESAIGGAKSDADEK
jgi:hypothetical protein